ncbi:sporulation histidine kinase inhibitor Sda [Aquibacillus sediminis]|nr:sporulation histidine kinase inhibitor Sda [Aquibacillus sediminis]
MSSLRYLSDELLIVAYHKSIELNLETDFIMMLVRELKYREIDDVIS